MRRVALIVMLTLLAACSAAPEPTDTYFRLDLPRVAALPRPALHGVIEVGQFSAEGLTGDRSLLYSYRGRPEELLRYNYNLWTEAPPALLQDQLVQALRDAHAADAVVTTDLRVAPDYVVEGKLRRFEEVLGKPSTVVVELDLGVVRLHGNQLMMLKTYRMEKPSASDRPSDAVAAFRDAVADVYSRFLADLTNLPVGR